MGRHISVNVQKCTGCRLCQLVCSVVKGGLFNLREGRIQLPPSYPFPSTPRVCQNCDNPDCVESCPSGALVRAQDVGLLSVEPDLCTGCGQCQEACAFGSIFLHPATRQPLVCDLCNREPVCVDVCPQRALVMLNL